MSSSESLARIVSGQLHRGGRLVTCVLLLCLGFHFLVSSVHAQGPGLYKDGKKILDLGEMVDSSFQPAAAPRLEQTAGMKLFREVFGEKMPSKDTPQKKYIRLVLECRDIVESIASYRDSDLAFMDGIGRLLVLEQRLLQANKLLLDKFSEIGKSLKENGYPAEKIDRHAEVIEGHTIAANRLSELLANLRSAHDSNDQASLEFLIQELKRYFIDNVFRKDPLLLSSQPLPVMMEVKKAPVVQDQLPPTIPYPIISKDGPDPADLDSTIDVQFTDDVIAMADSLNNSPVEMYNFVRDHFEFEPYLGSRKGSQQTLTHRRGNDYDQASLLIALLRVSGIPARYATGTVKMTIDQATNWLGIQDKRNAGSILTTCGMEGIIYIVNDDTVAISCRRVWVEAWIPFINYRGAINDSTGFMWVPMDPTFKQYSYQPGINLPAEIGFDAEAFVNDYISTFHSETPVELFRQMLLDSLAVYHPGADYEDLITMRSVIKETDGILPGTFPYTLMSMDSTFSEIASAKRYYIEFHLYDGAGMDLDYTTSLPEIAEKQVTISYVGATAADQEIIDTSGGIFNVDLPYLVDLKPVLKIDGCEVALATGDVMMGTTHYSDMHFTAPTGASNQI
ncbi:MAG: transglutaminase-like domain-containing protein, partial [Candidatus Zixiibacteriota bacterium]